MCAHHVSESIGFTAALGGELQSCAAPLIAATIELEFQVDGAKAQCLRYSGWTAEGASMSQDPNKCRSTDTRAAAFCQPRRVRPRGLQDSPKGKAMPRSTPEPDTESDEIAGEKPTEAFHQSYSLGKLHLPGCAGCPGECDAE